MRRGVAPYLVGSVVLVLLSGCGLFVYEKRAAWRDEAEQACLSAKGFRTSAYVETAREISGPGSCGMIQPFRISAFNEGSVGLTSRATLACPMASRADQWIAEVVQPSAQLYFGTPVTVLRAGSYSCRGVNGRQGGPRSEHSFGNAMDVMAFRFADGRELTVASGWKGSPQEQEFLREVFVNSCRYFTTVLGPGSDAFHYDHFHIDLARHNGGRRVCKPLIKFEPRLDPVAGTMVARTPPPEASRPAGSGYVTPPPLRATGRPMMLESPHAGAATPEGAEMDEPEVDSEPVTRAPLPPPAMPAPAVRRYP